MADVVVKLPVQEGEEARLFGNFLSSFFQSCCPEADQWAAANDSPYLIVHSEPHPDMEMKVLTFQQRRAARAFSRGWAKFRTTLSIHG